MEKRNMTILNSMFTYKNRCASEVQGLQLGKVNQHMDGFPFSGIIYASPKFLLNFSLHKIMLNLKKFLIYRVGEN